MVEKSSTNLDEAFKHADNFIKTFKDPNAKFSNEDKLQFYALYKYAMNGECTGKFLILTN
jgi:acyl-CoA-binding protein